MGALQGPLFPQHYLHPLMVDNQTINFCILMNEHNASMGAPPAPLMHGVVCLSTFILTTTIDKSSLPFIFYAIVKKVQKLQTWNYQASLLF